MTDEIKVVHVRHVLFGFHLLKIDAAFTQQGTDIFLFLLRRPLPDEVVQRGIFAADIFLRIIRDALLPEKFSVRIIDRYGFENDLHAAAAAIHDGLMPGRIRQFNGTGRY